MKIKPCLTILLMLAFVLKSAGLTHGAPQDKLTDLLGPNDAVFVATSNGRVVNAVQADQPMVPASILKILTAAAALRYLGPDYRFKTEFYLTPQNDLVIAGRGDPLLVSEEVAVISHSLARQITAIGDIITDGSYFASFIEVPGVSRSLNPYDATNGALCVNFNTVKFKTVSGKLVSAEPQTPLLPMVIERIRTDGLRNGRIAFAQSHRDNTRYAGHLFAHFLREAGVPISGSVRLGTTPANARKILTHRSSRDLPAVIKALMTSSNNFIANQIVLVLGAEMAGPPANLEKGLQVIRQYAQNDLGLQGVVMVEGSGISRQNRIPAQQMGRLLEAFEPYRRLLMNTGRAAYKTGTLSGIRTRAGYMEGQRGARYRFVIMLENSPADPDKIITHLLSSLP